MTNCVPTLRLILKDCATDVSNTAVSYVSSSSPFAGKIDPGDCITEVNGIDVHSMSSLGTRNASDL